MKIFLKLYIMLFMLVGFSTAHAAQSETMGLHTYTVVKGDTLSAIAKKFPGISKTALARINHIPNPNLIYANMVLRIPKASITKSATYTGTTKAVQDIKEKVSSLPYTALRAQDRLQDACNTEHGLDQLHYPDLVRNAFSSTITGQRANGNPSRGQTYKVSTGGNEYVFQISKNCVFTKIVKRDEEFWNIKQSIEEVLGPPHDATPLAAAILRQRQIQRGKQLSGQTLVSKPNDEE